MRLYGPAVTLTTLKKKKQQKSHCVSIINGEIESSFGLGGRLVLNFAQW